MWTAAAIVIFAPLSWATLRGWQAYNLLWTFAASLLLAAGLASTVTQTGIVLSSPPGTAYRDTYYVIVEGMTFAGMAVWPAILAALGFAAARWSTPLWTTAQKWAVWVYALGVIAPHLAGRALFFPPKRYVDYETAMMPVILAKRYGNLLAAAALLFLIVLPLWALIFRREAGTK